MIARFSKRLILLLFLSFVFNTFSIAQGNLGNTLSTAGIAENSLGEIFVGIRDSEIGTVYKSQDNGYSWKEIDSGIVWADVFEIKVAGNDYIYFTGYATGVYRSTSNGSFWEQTNLFNYLVTDSYALLVTDNDYIFVGIMDNPPYYLARSTDYGENWTDLSGWVSERVFSLASFQNNIYAGTVSGGVKVSTDYGHSWFQSSLDSLGITYLAVNHWGDIFAGCLSGEFYLSTDNGTNWYELSTPWANSYSSVASILPIGQDTVLVDLGRWASVEDSNLVYKSTDSGLSWVLIDNGINSDAIVNLLYSSDSSLYATTRDGLYKSTSFGNNWFPVEPFVTSLIDNELEYQLKDYRLEQNYPNPFNPSTKISYQLPQQGFVTLKVFDVLGKEVTTLVNEKKSAGSYEVDFSAKGLASGIYIYRMKVNEFIESKKMILIK